MNCSDVKCVYSTFPKQFVASNDQKIDVSIQKLHIAIDIKKD